MTISEFHAWLDGFSEAIGDAPTPDQWAKVLAKLKTVQALSVPQQMPLAPRPPYPGWPNPIITCDQGGQLSNVVYDVNILGMGHAASD